MTKVELMALRISAEEKIRIAQEQTVLDMVELGYSYKEIGQALGIGANRVYQIKRKGEIRREKAL